MRRLPGLTCTTSIPRFLWRETESRGHSGWTGSTPPKHCRPAGGTEENSWLCLSHPDPGRPPVWGRLLNPTTYWSWTVRGGGLASARLGVLITGSSSAPSPQEHPARLNSLEQVSPRCWGSRSRGLGPLTHSWLLGEASTEQMAPPHPQWRAPTEHPDPCSPLGAALGPTPGHCNLVASFGQCHCQLQACTP